MNPETSLFKGNELASLADILTTSKETILYFELFKKHNKFDYKAFVFDINDLFQEILTYFPKLIKRNHRLIQENQDRRSKRNEGVILSLISTKYKKRASSSSLKKYKGNKSIENVNNSQSSLFNSFLLSKNQVKNKNNNKSTIISLKSRKITLDENQIKKIVGDYKLTKKSNHFRILPENLSSIDDIHNEKSSLALENIENLMDDELLESVFKSKTVFHKEEPKSIYLFGASQDKIILPRIITTKEAIVEKKKEKEFQNQILTPLKGDTFKYMKPVVNMKSFQNLKYAAKDYLNRFIIKN